MTVLITFKQLYVLQFRVRRDLIERRLSVSNALALYFIFLKSQVPEVNKYWTQSISLSITHPSYTRT